MTPTYIPILAASIGATIVAIGWLVTAYTNRLAHVAQRRLDFRLKAFETFLPVWFAIQEHQAPFTQPGFLEQLKDARSKFQLYGYEDEISLMETFIQAVEDRNLLLANQTLTELVPLVRGRIRNELRIRA